MRVVITGAAGNVGQVLRQGLRGAYADLVLSDIRPPAAPAEGETWETLDIQKPAQLDRVFAGADVVVHLAAASLEAPWAQIQGINIDGTWNVFDAARRTSVGRVVFASSNHVTGYYRRDRRIGPDTPLRPDSRYGVSKTFGEALARMHADKYGMSVICIRIGSCQQRPKDARMLSTWLSHDDTVRLFRCAIDAPGIHFHTVYGVSANDRSFWDDAGNAALGYEPADNAEDFAATVLARPKGEPALERLFQGGSFCAAEFTGDPDGID